MRKESNKFYYKTGESILKADKSNKKSMPYSENLTQSSYKDSGKNKPQL